MDSGYDSDSSGWSGIGGADMEDVQEEDQQEEDHAAHCLKMPAQVTVEMGRIDRDQSQRAPQKLHSRPCFFTPAYARRGPRQPRPTGG